MRYLFNVSIIIDAGGDGYRCCNADYTEPLPEQDQHFGCMPVEVPKDDRYLSRFNIGCLNFVRTQTGLPNDCNLKPAELVGTLIYLLMCV